MEDSERRKTIELLKEMRVENKEDDSKSGTQDTRLNWMYKKPHDLIDKEEYLLGKPIDKTFQLLNSDGNSDITGRVGEQSNVPKKILERTENVEQVDIAKKILEDPLYAIKQKELEAKKKLLNNPVKLKQIKQMLLERSKRKSSNEWKKKKKKSEEDLNRLILKKLKKFTDKEKRKALNKIMQSSSSSSSSDSSSENKKRSSKQRGHSSSTESRNNDSEESGKKKKSKKKKKKESKESCSDSDAVTCEKSRKKRSKKSLSTSKSESSDSETSQENARRSKNSKVRYENNLRERSRKERNNEKQEKYNSKKERSRRDDSSNESRKDRKSYGLMMPDGSKPEVRKRTSPVRKYPKNAETKAKYIPPPKPKSLSERGRKELLKEMMKNAKLRKEDREKNLADHRRKQALEEESKTYDDDFMRRQMSKLTSQGTMADRIKSNINNIQRSKSSMDTSFMHK